MGNVVRMREHPGMSAPYADTPSSWIGVTVSHYRILEQLGGGGMGVVYRAIDENLDRAVALKFLPPQVSHLKEAKERFIQEAKAASALDHPNICTLYEIDVTDDDQLFIAMAYQPGETLKQRIERGVLGVAETVEVMRQIASGLAESHDHDIIHRDIKPANIWVNQGEPGRSMKVKILDFGLAKITGKADLTRTGSSMGTPAYMSPEHARGERVDTRTDLWSLGVLIYEVLTRQVPFTGGSIPAIMYSLLAREPRPLRDLRPEVPPELERVVSRLMRKQADERYGSCHELLAALARVPVPPEPSSTEVEAALAEAVACRIEVSPSPERLGLSPSAPPAVVLEALSPSPTSPEPETLLMSRPVAVSKPSRLVASTTGAPLAVPPVGAPLVCAPSAPSLAARHAASVAARGRVEASSPAHELQTSELPASGSSAASAAQEGFEEHLARGLEAALARSYDQAVTAFERALELKPGDPRAQFNLTRIRRRLEERGKLPAL